MCNMSSHWLLYFFIACFAHLTVDSRYIGQRNYFSGYGAASPFASAYQYYNPSLYTQSGSFYNQRSQFPSTFPGGGIPIIIDYEKCCSRKYVGMKPHPSYPEYYYICCTNSVIFAKCNNYQYFDASRTQCVPNTSPEYSLFCFNSGRFPVPADCRLYYKCEGTEKPLMYKCPNNMVFSAGDEKCVTGNQCPLTVVESDSPIVTLDCEDKFPPCSEPGVFRSTQDCSLCYNCTVQSDGSFLQSQHKCPNDDLFDSTQKICSPQSQDYIQITKQVYPQQPVQQYQPQYYDPHYTTDFLEKYPTEESMKPEESVNIQNTRFASEQANFNVDADSLVLTESTSKTDSSSTSTDSSTIDPDDNTSTESTTTLDDSTTTESISTESISINTTSSDPTSTTTTESTSTDSTSEDPDPTTTESTSTESSSEDPTTTSTDSIATDSSSTTTTESTSTTDSISTDSTTTTESTSTESTSADPDTTNTDSNSTDSIFEDPDNISTDSTLTESTSTESNPTITDSTLDSTFTQSSSTESSSTKITSTTFSTTDSSSTDHSTLTSTGSSSTGSDTTTTEVASTVSSSSNRTSTESSLQESSFTNLDLTSTESSTSDSTSTESASSESSSTDSTVVPTNSTISSSIASAEAADSNDSDITGVNEPNPNPDKTHKSHTTLHNSSIHSNNLHNTKNLKQNTDLLRESRSADGLFQESRTVESSECFNGKFECEDTNDTSESAESSSEENRVLSRETNLSDNKISPELFNNTPVEVDENENAESNTKSTNITVPVTEEQKVIKFIISFTSTVKPISELNTTPVSSPADIDETTTLPTNIPIIWEINSKGKSASEQSESIITESSSTTSFRTTIPSEAQYEEFESENDELESTSPKTTTTTPILAHKFELLSVESLSTQIPGPTTQKTTIPLEEEYEEIEEDVEYEVDESECTTTENTLITPIPKSKSKLTSSDSTSESSPQKTTLSSEEHVEYDTIDESECTTTENTPAMPIPNIKSKSTSSDTTATMTSKPTTQKNTFSSEEGIEYEIVDESEPTTTGNTPTTPISKSKSTSSDSTSTPTPHRKTRKTTIALEKESKGSVNELKSASKDIDLTNLTFESTWTHTTNPTGSTTTAQTTDEELENYEIVLNDAFENMFLNNSKTVDSETKIESKNEIKNTLLTLNEINTSNTHTPHRLFIKTSDTKIKIFTADAARKPVNIKNLTVISEPCGQVDSPIAKLNIVFNGPLAMNIHYNSSPCDGSCNSGINTNVLDINVESKSTSNGELDLEISK